MKFKYAHQTLGALALAAAVVCPAQAAVMTFEGVAPGTLLFPGETATEAGMVIQATFSASVIDTSAAFGPGVGLDLAGPRGNNSQFFIGLNDGGAKLRAQDNSVFKVTGFNFGFVSALSQLFNPGDVPGLLIADYVNGTGGTGFEVWSFGQADANGEFSFQTAGAAAMGALGLGVQSVEFYGCTANNAGDCVNRNANFSQFALDNIGTAAVPEPGALALVVLALGLTAGLRRRAA